MYTRWIIWGILICLLALSCNLGCDNLAEPQGDFNKPVSDVPTNSPPLLLYSANDTSQQEDLVYIPWSDTLSPVKPGGAIGKGVVVVPVVRREDTASRFYSISYGDHSDAAITFSYPITGRPTADLWVYSGPYDWRYEQITHFGVRVLTRALSGRRFQCLDSVIILKEGFANEVLSIGEEISTAIPLPRPLRRDVLQGQEGYLPEYSYLGHSRDRVHIRLIVLQLWRCVGKKPNPVQFIFDFYNEQGELTVSVPCSIGFVPSPR